MSLAGVTSPRKFKRKKSLSFLDRLNIHQNSFIKYFGDWHRCFISVVCHDLNQDIAQHFHVSDHEAFDMSREQIMNDLCGPENIVTGDKHNSLYDAEVIRAIWRVL